jgi:type IV pilus assembly protein PilM
MATRVVGLDIGTFAVRAAELSLGGQQPSLVRFGQVTLPVGAVRDGEIADVGAVSAAIRRLWSEAGFKTKKVVVGVANQRVIVRQADLPAMSEADLRAALKFEAQELIPIPVEDAILDFQILEEGITTGADADVRMRILLAAAQREMVRTHLAALEGAGLEALAVDVLPFALVRTLTLGANVFDSDASAEAIVCIGAGVTNVVVHEHGIPRFVRVLLVGGGDVTDAIARDLNVDFDTAEDLKRRADIGSADASVSRAGQIVAERVIPLVEEIRGSLDYYLAQAQSSPIGRILVTGGGSRMTGLLERLQSQLGGRVEPARPLSAIATGDVNLSQAQLADLEPLLTVPIGLALAGEVQKGLRRISLLPSEVAVLREHRRQAALVGGTAAGLAAVLLILWAAKASQVSDERGKANEAEQRVEELRRQEAKLRGATTLGAEVTQRKAQVNAVLVNDIAWTRLFHDVATVIPSDVWLTTFTGGKSPTGGTVTFGGRGFDHTSTARWLLRIGDLNSLSGLWVPSSTKSLSGGTSSVTFSSNANLTPAARMDRTARYTGEEQ